jgi:hypothetical protein
MPEIEFVLARRQNAFFSELAAILRDELRALGIEATTSIGTGSRPRPEVVQVLLPPHEYVALAGDGLPPDRIGRMMFICAEPPASPWFEGNVRLAPFAGAMFDINQASVEEFAARGIDARHLQLGYSASWDRFDPDAERDVDVAFLGCATERRGRLLAGYAPTLARLRSELVISDNDRPNPASAASFLAGEDKWSLLRRSKVLLNVHRESHPPYFEWVRVLEAIHCGAVVVSEPSSHFAPLEPGRHFAVGRAEELDRLAEELLHSPDRLDSIRRDSYEYIRTRLPMSEAASMLADAAEAIAARPTPRHRRRLPRPRAIRGAIASAIRRRRGPDDAEGRTPKAPSDQPTTGEAVVRRRTGAWGEPRPISVIVLGRDLSDLVEALDSTVADGAERIELVVVDGGSVDRADRWFADHASTAALLLAGPAGRGPAASLSAAISRAGGDLLLPMSSDDRLLPNGIDRLSAALSGDPQAAFAYGVIQGIGDHGPDRLFNQFGWEPARLADADYIRPPALIRRAALEQIGGYRPGVWSAFAERGMHGTHVRQFVASSRATGDDAPDRAEPRRPAEVDA